jgi:hypothetical protein
LVAVETDVVGKVINGIEGQNSRVTGKECLAFFLDILKAVGIQGDA